MSSELLIDNIPDAAKLDLKLRAYMKIQINIWSVMHIISFKTLRVFFGKYPSAEAPLKKWFKVITANDFKNFAELKQLFPSADQVKRFVMFNIGGNKYRLIAFLAYDANRLYVRNVLTHKEYDKDKWKEDSWFSSNK